MILKLEPKLSRINVVENIFGSLAERGRPGSAKPAVMCFCIFKHIKARMANLVTFAAGCPIGVTKAGCGRACTEA